MTTRALLACALAASGLALDNVIEAGGLDVTGGIVADELTVASFVAHTANSNTPGLTVRAARDYASSVVALEAARSGGPFAFVDARLEDESVFSVDGRGAVYAAGGVTSGGGDLVSEGPLVLARQVVRAGEAIAVEVASSFVVIENDHVRAANALAISAAGCVAGQILVLQNLDADPATGTAGALAPGAASLLVFDGSAWLPLSSQAASGWAAGVTADLDIGDFALQASQLVASSQVPGQLALYGGGGKLSGSPALTFSGDTLFAEHFSAKTLVSEIDAQGHAVHNAAMKGGSAVDMSIVKSHRFVHTAARPGEVAVFGKNGEMESGEALKFSGGALHVPMIGSHKVTGAVDFDSNVLRNPRIVNATVDSLEEMTVDRVSVRDALTTTGVVTCGSDVHVDGSVLVRGSVVGAGPYVDSSDLAFKTNVRPLHGSLAMLLQMSAVSYKQELRATPERHDFGMIANELADLVPEVVVSGGGSSELHVAYSKLVPLLVESVKTLSAEVAQLRRDLSVHTSC